MPMKKVYTAGDPVGARLALGLLEENGIEAVIQGEALWAARGELPLTSDSAPSIWVVHDGDAERARELILSKEGVRNPERCAGCGYQLRSQSESLCPECGEPFRETDTAWTCGGCGEQVEGQFTHCWKCGEGRQADSL